MPNEFIHYVKRIIVTRYPKDIDSSWFSELQEYESGFDTPVYHITRLTNWPAIVVKTGDIIWLVSQLSSPWGKLPPSIDAYIRVKSIEQKSNECGEIKIRYNASEDSKWFPLTDATKMLFKLTVISKSGKITTPYNPEKDNLGQAFQSMKKIQTTEVIREWAEKVEKSDLHFISYRIVDGTKMAFMKTDYLLKKGLSVFWDRWSLPRRLAERRELVSDESLDLLIENRIHQAVTVWGIESPKYNEVCSYSAKEKMLATNLNKYQSG